MRALLLAGGNGTRLAPNTTAVNKHLLPIFDKPLIYFSLSSIMLANIRDVRVVIRRSDSELFERLLGNGSDFGLNLTYGFQDAPLGIPDTIKVASEYLAGSNFAMGLGDNVFFGSGLSGELQRMVSRPSEASILLKSVPDPERFGVAWTSSSGRVERLEEKPANPTSNLAVTGLYHLPSRAVDLAQDLTPSHRGELEITDLLNCFLNEEKLTASTLPRGTMWLDTGTTEAMMDASNFVRSFQDLSGVLIGSPHEIAWRNGWIGDGELGRIAHGLKSSYGNALSRLVA